MIAASLWDGAVDALPALDELRRAVEAQCPVKGAPPQQRSSIEAYRALIEPLALKGVGPQAIHDRLRQEHSEFCGSVSAVKRLCLSIRRERGVRAQDVVIPLQTDPGQEAQVDFGYVGHLYDPAEGRLRKAYVFVMVLSYSRHQFARICFDQKVETWLLLHIEAFEHFQGVPAIIVPEQFEVRGRARSLLSERADDAQSQLSRASSALQLQDRADTAKKSAEEGQGRVVREVREEQLLQRPP